MIGAAPERRALRRAPAVQDRHFSRYVTFQPGHAGGYLTTPRLFGLSSGLKQLHSLAIDAAGVSIGSMTRGLCEGAFEVAKFTERKCMRPVPPPQPISSILNSVAARPLQISSKLPSM
ncbi:MAG: hypothetical protein DMG16_02735 [Acidobacteria bacterium]|nr:MAG: hypothetical protein DMG16_02735 [Acidobacteriota bacterium]